MVDAQQSWWSIGRGAHELLEQADAENVVEAAVEQRW
jgi:hypothetical protein